MSRIIQVNDSDYKVKVRYNGQDDSNGVITLDVGTSPGNVIVTGDLTVYGNTTTVKSSTVSIVDNIIVVNNQLGENGQPTGNGILSATGEAGIEIGRGVYSAGQMVFSESLWWFDNQTNSNKQGAFVFKTKNTLLTGIRTNSITTNDKDQNLNLLGPSPHPGETGTGSAVVAVDGVVNYADRINHKLYVEQNQIAYDNSIPNVKWVNGAIAGFFSTTPPNFIARSDTRFQVFDTQSGDAESKASLLINGVTNAEFKIDAFTTQNFSLSNGTLSTTDLGLDLTLRAAGTGSVVIDDNLKITLTIADPDQTNGSITLYTKSEAYGGTGVYFVNNEATRDELVSRRKALAYSMIF
jgi:hypothetical protein